MRGGPGRPSSVSKSERRRRESTPATGTPARHNPRGSSGTSVVGAATVSRVRMTILVCLAAVAAASVAGAAAPPQVPRDTDPYWSPQATTIAFFREAPTIQGDVLFTPAARGAEIDLAGEGRPRGFRQGSGELLVEREGATAVLDAETRTLGRIPGVDATWSPDGSRIAFLQGEALAVAAPDGSNVQTLATGIVPPPADRTGPAWSPDGHAIAIANGSSIDVVAADGSERHVAFGQPGDNVDPNWSHDGTTIAFQRSAGGRWSIWLVSPDGTNAHEAALGATANNRFPQWSPVDARLAFLSDSGGRYALYVGTIDGIARKLVDAVNPDSPARWSPDGGRLAVSSSLACARFGIYVVRTTPTRRSNQCRIDGGPGADVLRGTPYFDRIDGNGGNDRLFGNGGNDVIDGGIGNDGVGGGSGDDVIYGGPGNDILSGGTGNDVIYAGPGHDKIGCGPGRDTVHLEPGDTARDCERVRRTGS
jgi:Tol biopolymer transport system component